MSTWTSERARIAALTRGIRAGERPADDPALAEAYRNLRALRAEEGPADDPAQRRALQAEEYIKKTLSKAPPLTDEQRSKLAELLKPVRV